MRPRIGQVNKYWGRDRGGVEAVLRATAEELAARGYPQSVLACRPWGSAARPFPAGVRGRELAAPVIARMPAHPGFAAALARLQRECDLLHFHLPFPLAEAAALLLPQTVPWVATAHAEVWERGRWTTRLQRAITRRFLERTQALVVSSPPRSQAPELAPYQDRLHVIPFGFELRPYQAPRPRRPDGAGIVVMFLGRLVAYKGVDVLLRAIVRLPARAHIVGDGPQRRSLERLARQLRIADRVAFFGHLPDREVPRRYAEADIFALPSRSPAETFGVAQIEAMAAGLPVVNTALGTGTDWVSQHGITGLTTAPGDAAGLAAALGYLIEHPEFRLACGRRARLRAQQLFGARDYGDRIEALYGQLLGRAAGAA